MAENYKRFQGNKETSPLAIYMRYIEESKKKDSVYKYIGIGSFAALLLSLCVCAWTATLPKTNPLVIYVSDWGEAKYIGDVSKNSYANMKIPEGSIEFYVKRFVKNLFSLSTDAYIVKQNLTECYASVTDTCAEKLTAMLKADDPRRKVGTIAKIVDIESVLKLSAKSYQVDFIVTEQEKTGKVIGKKRMRGVLEVELLTPSDDDREFNPLGIFMSNYDFSIVSGNVN